MKPQKTLVFKSLVSLLLAGCVLASGLLLIAASEETPKPIGTESLTPDVSEAIENSESPSVNDGTTPTAQTQLEGEFGQYSFVSEEEGKRVVTIYSAKQIADFVSRRESGEWFTLTAEEVLYLVSDTRMLFEKYDIIRVYDLEGNLNTYRGMPFYSSEEYDSAFGLVTEETDATFNLSEDIHFATVNRLTVLCSAVAQPDDCNSTQITVLFTGVEQYPEGYDFLDGQQELDLLGRTVDNYWFWQRLTAHDYAWYEAQGLQAYEGGAFLFVTKSNATLNERAYYISDISALDFDDYTCLYDSRELYDAGTYEYAYEGKSVVVEIWDENAKKVVARVRLDDTNDAAEVAEIEALWNGAWNYLNSEAYEGVDTDDYFYTTDYTVNLYLHNIGTDGIGKSTTLHYRVDDNCDIWSFGTVSLQPVFQLRGTSALAQYVNAIAAERLAAD